MGMVSGFGCGLEWSQTHTQTIGCHPNPNPISSGFHSGRVVEWMNKPNRARPRESSVINIWLFGHPHKLDTHGRKFLLVHIGYGSNCHLYIIIYHKILSIWSDFLIFVLHLKIYTKFYMEYFEWEHSIINPFSLKFKLNFIKFNLIKTMFVFLHFKVMFVKHPWKDLPIGNCSSI
jgi:hypothetical protein